jgi:hypothetical protein
MTLASTTELGWYDGCENISPVYSHGRLISDKASLLRMLCMPRCRKAESEICNSGSVLKSGTQDLADVYDDRSCFVKDVDAGRSKQVQS